MGKIGGIALIVTGIIILLNVIIMAIGGFKGMMGLTMPIGLHFVPVNEKLQAWIDVPLSMGLEAVMDNVRSIDEEGYIGGGMIDFKVTLSSGGPDDEEFATVAVVFIQEDAEIDEIQRYVLRCGPLNYPSLFFWVVALGSLVGLVLAIVKRVKMRGTKPDKEAIAPEPPPETIVSVIPMEDNDDVEAAAEEKE
ncbi:unnamed protein product [Orchesella dallaii]|uniref:Uncharacterized protein n=1 Tax=Orchesella dallaii TaxID=48710 RepID=A0ABP1S0X8_9HEXA